MSYYASVGRFVSSIGYQVSRRQMTCEEEQIIREEITDDMKKAVSWLTTKYPYTQTTIKPSFSLSGGVMEMFVIFPTEDEYKNALEAATMENLDFLKSFIETGNKK